MSKRVDTWMPLYISDYLRDTMHLSAEQHGAYLLLIMAAWSRGGRLPNDDAQLAATAKLSLSVWRKHKAVLMPYFRTDGAELVQGRCEGEAEKARRLSETRREVGLRGGRPKTNSDCKPEPKGSANGKQPETPSPSPREEGSVANATGAEVAVADERPDYDKDAWTGAVKLIRSRGDVSEKSARSLFGKLLSTNGLEARDLLPAIASAQVNGTADPQGYLTRAAQGVARRRGERAGSEDEFAAIRRRVVEQLDGIDTANHG